MKKIMIYLLVFLILTAAALSLETECYQEFANVSTGCGGLSTGNYLCTGMLGDCKYLLNGNWTTGNPETFSLPVIPDGYFYVNYTKPENVTGAKWKIQLDATNYTLSINRSCRDQSIIQLRYYGSIILTGGTPYYQCYSENENNWLTLRHSGGNVIGEEAIIWTIDLTDTILLSWNFNAGGSYQTITDGNMSWVLGELLIGNNSGTTYMVETELPYISLMSDGDIDLLSPSNTSTNYNGRVLFKYNITSTLDIIQCDLWYGKWNDFSRRRRDSSITPENTYNYTFNIEGLESGEYNWTIKCLDTNYNTHTHDNWTIVVSIAGAGETAPAGGGGDGIAAAEEITPIKDILPLDILKEISFFAKLFPDYSLNIKDNGVCEPGEDPIFINRNDCQFGWNTFFTNGLYRMAWVTRYLTFLILLVFIMPVSLPAKAQRDRKKNGFKFKVMNKNIVLAIVAIGIIVLLIILIRPTDNSTVNLISPLPNQMVNDSDVVFKYNITSEYNIVQCDLFYGQTEYLHHVIDDALIANSINNFTANHLVDGWYTWTVACTNNESTIYTVQNQTFLVNLTED